MSFLPCPVHPPTPPPPASAPAADSVSLVEHSQGPEVLLATREQGKAGTEGGCQAALSWEAQPPCAHCSAPGQMARISSKGWAGWCHVSSQDS